MLPNFLIIGAARCATGWISQCLREHPEIFVARDETHFFDLYYDKGLAWYEQAFFSEYKGEKAVGEKTAEYMFNPKVPQRIAVSLPRAKLICCLRDPIERFYSHYIARRALARKIIFSDLVQRGLYFKQIKQFLKANFSQENLLIKIYEDKYIDPVGFIQGIYEFLSVDNTFVPLSANLQTKQGALEYKNKLGFVASQVLFHPKSPFARVHAFKVLYSKIRPKWNKLDVNEHSLKKLARLYDTDIAQLEEFLGRDLRCWKSKVLRTS